MTKENLKIALVQLCSVNHVEANKKQILEIMSQIPADIDFITLPENAFFIRTHELQTIEYIDFESDFWNPFQEFCKKRNCYLHIGATPLLYQKQKWNSTVLISPEGQVSAPYQKLHLFDIHLENRNPISESAVFQYGISPAIIEIYGWKLGLTICYDLRFSELFFYYQSQQVDMILTPAAFLVETGKMHWDILQRARAIESQCYIVAAAQGGHHGDSKTTYGHSLVVSPWGTKVVEILDDSKPSFQICELHKSEIQKMRTQIPMHSHRRLHVSFKNLK